MMHHYKKMRGVTLLEVLLVLAIASAMLVMLIGFVQQKADELRRNRVSLQMQQVLNAGLAYYVQNNKWPATLADLQGKYLPPSSVKFNNPWGQSIDIKSSTGAGMFYVYTNVMSSGNAQIVAGRLPLSFVSDATGVANSPPDVGGCGGAGTLSATCTYTVGSVNIPGQNLNNATAVNFAGMYHSGACVPAPVCPVDRDGNTMKPAVFVVPASVSGAYDEVSGLGTTSNPTNVNVYPLNSFTAFARGGQANGTSPVDPNASSDGPPLDCATTVTPQKLPCNFHSANMPNYPTIPTDGTKYWRVCLSVVTEKGAVSPQDPETYPPGVAAHGVAMGTVLVFTRCIPSAGESGGSGFTVWAPGYNWKP